MGTSDSKELSQLFNGVSDDLANEIEGEKEGQTVKQSQLKLYKREKSNIGTLKRALTHLVDDMLNIFNKVRAKDDSARNVVFVIDELDRCRPHYAIELLESIKHLFSAPNIVFLLVINREQLQHSINGVYGSNFDAAMYLEKFIHLNVNLPIGSKEGLDQNLAFLTKYVEEHSRLLDIHMGDPVFFAECLQAIKAPPRQVNKAIIAFGILQNSTRGTQFMSGLVVNIVVSLCVLSCMNRDVFLRFANCRSFDPKEKLLTEIHQDLGSQFTNCSRELRMIFSGGIDNRRDFEKKLARLKADFPSCTWRTGIDLVSDICDSLRCINS